VSGRDESWLARPVSHGARSRSQQEIADLYEEHVWGVYGFFGYRVRSRADAEDLTQLTFERAVRAWDRFDPNRASARTWLMSIASNLLIDHYRRDLSAHEDPIEDHAVRQELIVEDADLGLSPELAAAIERLGERERELLALRFGGDLTGPEIAELTGLTLANVQQILSRSLRKIRLELGKSA
jgi:RNA polymerase sigma factor (sigma-70 family)